MKILIIGGAGEAFLTMADLGRAILCVIGNPTASKCRTLNRIKGPTLSLRQVWR